MRADGADGDRRTDAWPRLTAWAAWAAAAVVMLLMAWPMLRGQVHIHDDLGGFHLPTRAFYAQQLARGESFAWMPGLFAGFFASGEGQIGGFHPLHWLLYRWLPLGTAFELELLLSYPFLFAGMYSWLRRHVRGDVALLGSLAFTFSSFNLLHFVHPNAIAVVAHLPWLLAAIDRIADRPGEARGGWALLAVAVLTASQILLGYPQYVWLSAVAEMSYAAWRLAVRRQADGSAPQRAWPAWLELAAAKGLGAMLAAVQLLPTCDAMLHSARRTVDAEFVNSFALHPANLLQLVAPYMFRDRVLAVATHEFGLYLGAVPLLLIVWLGYRWRDLGRLRGLATAALLFAAVTLLLSLGNTGVIYRLQRLLPVVGSFRCPSRYIVLFELATAVLAALGFALLARQTRSGRTAMWQELRPLAFVVGLSFLAAVAGLILRHHPRFSPSAWGTAAGPLLMAGGAALIALAARGRAWALVGLVLFTAADLGYYGLTYAVTTGHCSLQHYTDTTARRPVEAVTPTLDASGFPLRVLGGENPLAMIGWTRLDGYAGLEPARRLDYSRLASLQAAGVRWLQVDKKRELPAGLRRLPGGWLEVPDPLPVVRLVSRAQTSGDPGRDLSAIDVRTTVLTSEPVELDAGPPGRLVQVDHRPGRIDVTLDTPGRQILTVAESWHPGWRAVVDGRRQALLAVNGDFMGCSVGPGKHMATFEFQPASVWYGTWISLAGAGLVGLIALRRVAQSRPIFLMGGRGALSLTPAPHACGG